MRAVHRELLFSIFSVCLVAGVGCGGSSDGTVDGTSPDTSGDTPTDAIVGADVTDTAASDARDALGATDATEVGDGAALDAATCTPTPPTPAGMCNTLDGWAGISTWIHLTCPSGGAPTPKGGTVLEGTYGLTGMELLSGPCPADLTKIGVERGKWLVCGTTWQNFRAASNWDGTGTINERTSFDAVMLKGGILTLPYACPALSTSRVYDYDATPTTLTLYRKVGGPPDLLFADHYTRL